MLFTAPIDKSVNRLSRFKLVNDKITTATEKVIAMSFILKERSAATRVEFT